MQLITLEHGHWNFFCPVTGKEVYKEEGGVNAETFRGGWHQEVPNEPLELAQELQEPWEAYLDKIEEGRLRSGCGGFSGERGPTRLGGL